MQSNSSHSNRPNLRFCCGRSEKRAHNVFQLRYEPVHAALSQQRRFASDFIQSSSRFRRFSFSHSSFSLVSVRRSALALYYRVLESSPHLLHLFFSVSLSMFENTPNTDLLITKNVQKHVFDSIIAWRTSHSSLSGWICLEFLNPGSLSVFEVSTFPQFHFQTIMKLLLDRNSLHLGSLMHSCISAIEWCQSSENPEPEVISLREKVPHLEENAWMLLSLISKVAFFKMINCSIISE